MSDVSDFLNTYVATEYIQYATEYTDGVPLLGIGDEILSPNDKCYLLGTVVYDQLLADGSTVDASTHPLYWATLEDKWGDSRAIDTSYSDNPRGVDYHDGALWIAYRDESYVAAYSYDTGEFIETVAISYPGTAVQGIHVTDNYIYTAHDSGGSDSTILRTSRSDGSEVSISLDGISSSLPDVTGDTDGYIYVYADDGTVSKYTSDLAATGDSWDLTSVMDTTDLWFIEYTDEGFLVNNSGESTYRLDFDFSEILEEYDVESRHGIGYVNSGEWYVLYTGYVETYGRFRPDMDSGSEELPYRVIADMTEDV